MSRNKHELKTAIFDDGTHAVLRADPVKPRHMEVIATFYQAAHARDYVRRHSTPSEQHRKEQRPSARRAAKRRPRQAAAAKFQSATQTGRPTPPRANPKTAAKAATKRPAAVQPKSAPAAKPKTTEAGISDRQMAVLRALRSLKDKKNRVEVPVAKIAKASSVPLGSVHSILASLEKKHMIRTQRQGSPKASAIYEVLQTSPKRTGSLNGGSHLKPPHAQAAR
jgi:DNA-binding transcriptional ArsR family regulator